MSNQKHSDLCYHTSDVFGLILSLLVFYCDEMSPTTLLLQSLLANMAGDKTRSVSVTPLLSPVLELVVVCLMYGPAGGSRHQAGPVCIPVCTKYTDTIRAQTLHQHTTIYNINLI